MDADLVAEHVFEAAGLGHGPFRCVGLFSLPPPSLAGQNPDAYNNALRSIPRGYGGGTCAYCGQAIMHCYMIKAACGATFSVGSECVFKTGEAKLIAQAKLQKKRADRERRERERLVRIHVRIEIGAIIASGERIERDAAALLERQAREARRGECISANGWLIDALRGKGSSPFCAEMAAKLETTHWTDMRLSPRAVAILRDIYAKSAGRGGSKAHAAAAAEFDLRTTGGAN